MKEHIRKAAAFCKRLAHPPEGHPERQHSQGKGAGQVSSPHSPAPAPDFSTSSKYSAGGLLDDEVAAGLSLAMSCDGSQAHAGPDQESSPATPTQLSADGNAIAGQVGTQGTMSINSKAAVTARSQQPAPESFTLAISSSCPSALRRSSWSVNDFDLRAVMYHGSMSIVYHAVDKRSGVTVALKLYKRHKLTSIERHQVAREIKLHIGLAHPSIIGLYAAWKDRNYVYMALEWAPGGDIYSYLHGQGGKLTEEVAVTLILEPFLSGLQAIHAQGLIHRDIKPENILLNRSFEIKIADFGLSIDSSNEVANTRLGTIDYLAPEILECPVKQNPQDGKHDPSIGYTNKVDCWSVGVLAYELLVGQPPFAASSAQQTLRLIRTKNVEYPSFLSLEAVDFFHCSLVRDPTRRSSIKQLLNHPFITRQCLIQRALAEGGRYMRRNSMPLSFTATRQNLPQMGQASNKALNPADPMSRQRVEQLQQAGAQLKQAFATLGFPSSSIKTSPSDKSTASATDDKSLDKAQSSPLNVQRAERLGSKGGLSSPKASIPMANAAGGGSGKPFIGNRTMSLSVDAAGKHMAATAQAQAAAAAQAQVAAFSQAHTVDAHMKAAGAGMQRAMPGSPKAQAKDASPAHSPRFGNTLKKAFGGSPTLPVLLPTYSPLVASSANALLAQQQQHHHHHLGGHVSPAVSLDGGAAAVLPYHGSEGQSECTAFISVAKQGAPTSAEKARALKHSDPGYQTLPEIR